MPPKQRETTKKEAPASLADLKKKRAQSDSAAASRRVAVAGVMVLLAVLGAFVLRRENLQDHPQYKEALRILRNDGLEASDLNIRMALRLIDVATQPYSEKAFKVVDPQEWAPRCSQVGRSCQERPRVGVVRRLSEGEETSLLELEAERAKVWLIEDLVSEEEAASLMRRIARVNFTTSPTNHATGQDWRSSSSAVIPRSDPEMQVLLQRAAALCGVPLSHLEAPQVVRYRPGERYQPHMDSEGAHHRHWTLLLYLNDPGGGGATAFPLLDLKVLPAPRTAVFWENLRTEAGHPDPVRNYFTVHDGQAPTGSEPKFAVNLWVRAAPYDPGM